MRDALTPEQMAKWKAFRELQPDVMERICNILKIGFSRFVNVMGGESDPNDFELCEEKKWPEPIAGPAQTKAILTASVGNSGDCNR